MKSKQMHAVGLFAAAALTAVTTAALAVKINSVALDKTTQLGTQSFIVVDAKHESLALQGFSFRFEKGDHKIRAITLWPNGEKVMTSFVDKNDDDPYSVKARWSTLSTAPSITSKRKVAAKVKCKGTCTLTLAEPPSSSHRLLLTGFQLVRTSGEANVKRIAIRSRGAGTYDVVLQDQGGADSNMFNVQLSYLYYKGSYFKHWGTANGSKKNKETKAILKKHAPGMAVISGFDISFTNGDHHLTEFSIMPTDDAFEVRFNDHNVDDEFTATVDYGLVDVEKVRITQ